MLNMHCWLASSPASVLAAQRGGGVHSAPMTSLTIPPGDFNATCNDAPRPYMHFAHASHRGMQWQTLRLKGSTAGGGTMGQQRVCPHCNHCQIALLLPYPLAATRMLPCIRKMGPNWQRKAALPAVPAWLPSCLDLPRKPWQLSASTSLTGMRRLEVTDAAALARLYQQRLVRA